MDPMSPPTPEPKIITRAKTAGARSPFSSLSAAVLLLSVVAVQLGLLSALYWQNMQLSSDIGEFRARADTFKSLMEKKEECSCPACPTAENSVLLSLSDLHLKFEATSDKLIKGVENVENKIQKYAKKFEFLIKKIQKFVPMDDLGF